MNVDCNVGHSLSAGGPGASSALLAPVGSPWTRFSRRSLVPSVPINFADGTPFVYKLVYNYLVHI
ncbi:hypothetical protein ABIE66_001920 [Peribacillus sp. B2I2]